MFALNTVASWYYKALECIHFTSVFLSVQHLLGPVSNQYVDCEAIDTFRELRVVTASFPWNQNFIFGQR